MKAEKDDGCRCPRCHDHIPEQFYCRNCGYVIPEQFYCRNCGYVPD